jgi:hypothetical protein
MTVSDCVASPMTLRAAPKSTSSGSSLPASRMMLSGAMSRCRQSSAWMTASASVSGSSKRRSQASSGGASKARSLSRSVTPSYSGMTM